MKKIIKEPWGHAPDGSEVFRWTLSGDKLSVSIINFGATVQRMTYDGRDIIFSLPDVEKYAKFSFACIGATVGRYAGRIAGGEFCLNGVKYRLTQNHEGNHLHGGAQGFHTKVWDGDIVDCDGSQGLELHLFSPDGSEGYPGDLNVSAVFTVTQDDRFQIVYRAKCDKKDTILNLTNHCYFNLNGIRTNTSSFPESDSDNNDVELMINADFITEQVNSLPTGKLLPVDGTPFDFRTPKILACDMSSAEETAKNGYDHFFVLREQEPNRPSVTAYSRRSGIFMECFTNRPGVQLFTMGNPGDAFALEAQSFPDAPNHPNFPTTVLRAGEEWCGRIIYQFSTK